MPSRACLNVKECMYVESYCEIIILMINIYLWLTWVNCFGVPVHAWNEDCFSQIFNHVGSFVTLDLATRNRKRLDVGRGLISTTSLVKIDRIIKLKIGDRIFDVSLMEDKVGGVPLTPKEIGAENQVVTTSDEDVSSEDSDGRSLFQKEDTNSQVNWDDEDVDRVPDSLQGCENIGCLETNKLEVIQKVNRLPIDNSLGLSDKEETILADVCTRLDEGDDKLLKEIKGLNETEKQPMVTGFLKTVCEKERGESMLFEVNGLNGESGPHTPVGLAGVRNHIEGGYNLNNWGGNNRPWSGKIITLEGKEKEIGSGPSKPTKPKAKIGEVGHSCGLRKKVTAGQRKGGVRILEKKLGHQNKSFTQKRKNKKVVCGKKSLSSESISESTSGSQEVMSSRKQIESIKCGGSNIAVAMTKRNPKLPRLQPSSKIKRRTAGARQQPKKMTKQASSSKVNNDPKEPSFHSQMKSIGDTGIDASINNSINDSHIRSCTRLHYRDGEEVPQRLWSSAKMLGVSFDGNEVSMVHKMAELDKRDRRNSEEVEHHFVNGQGAQNGFQ
ncbi:hypothetical protein RIF29_27384 [Crotalaria pallida]|uniref:DUF4283 domain-containing protein n=1 Tax=Crotalaria pallida TaxID=3830 RepID=A0AAN9ER61_CROPI